MSMNIFMVSLLFISIFAMGSQSFAKSKTGLSPGARKAEAYFKHNDDYMMTLEVVNKPKAKVAATKYKKRQLASQSKKALITKKSVKRKVTQNKNKKLNSKLRRELASKGIPVVLPKKKK